jgi:hypothetical protein
MKRKTEDIPRPLSHSLLHVTDVAFFLPYIAQHTRDNIKAGGTYTYHWALNF